MMHQCASRTRPSRTARLTSTSVRCVDVAHLVSSHTSCRRTPRVVAHLVPVHAGRQRSLGLTRDSRSSISQEIEVLLKATQAAEAGNEEDPGVTCRHVH